MDNHTIYDIMIIFIVFVVSVFYNTSMIVVLSIVGRSTCSMQVTWIQQLTSF